MNLILRYDDLMINEMHRYAALMNQWNQCAPCKRPTSLTKAQTTIEILKIWNLSSLFSTAHITFRSMINIKNDIESLDVNVEVSNCQ